MSEVVTAPRRHVAWARAGNRWPSSRRREWAGTAGSGTRRRRRRTFRWTALDPDVAAAIRLKVDDVRKNGRSAAAWGALGQLLLAHEDADQADGLLRPGRTLRSQRAALAVLPRTDPSHAGSRRHRCRFCGGPRRLCDRYDRGNDGPAAALAETLLQAGADAEAPRTSSSRVLSLDPDNPHVHFDLGVLARERKDDDSRRASISSRPPKSPYARQKSCPALAAIHHGQGKEAEAAEYDRRAAAPPEDSPWDDPYIGEYSRCKSAAAAVSGGGTAGGGGSAAGRAADPARPGEGRLGHPRQIAAGKALIRLGRLEDAERYFRAAIGKESQQAEANNFLAFALYTEGEQEERTGGDAKAKYREALACSRKALELEARSRHGVPVSGPRPAQARPAARGDRVDAPGGAAAAGTGRAASHPRRRTGRGRPARRRHRGVPAGAGSGAGRPPAGEALQRLHASGGAGKP